MEKKKVLVAGASGYLGRFVVKVFKESGYWIRALVRESSVRKLEKTGEFLQPAIKEYIDDLFIGEATKPDTINGVCDGVDIVFSSLGITRQKDRLTFKDVDYGANKNILKEAIKSKTVEKFIFVSVFNAKNLLDIDVIKWREQFVDELKSSSINYSIIRPTGYYSDMTEFLKMGLKGSIYLIGDGNNRMNPIYGEDLAKVCLDSIKKDNAEIDAGGPEIYSYNEIAGIISSLLGKKISVIHIPKGVVKTMSALIKPFSSKYYTMMKFFLTAMTSDSIAPRYGGYDLESYYREWLRVSGYLTD